MQSRKSPLLLIALVVALFVVLAVVAATIPQAESAHDSEGAQPEPNVNQPQPQAPPTSPQKMMDQVKAVEKSSKTGPGQHALVGPQSNVKPPPPDRDEEGSSNWWSNSTSPKGPGK